MIFIKMCTVFSIMNYKKQFKAMSNKQQFEYLTRIKKENKQFFDKLPILHKYNNEDSKDYKRAHYSINWMDGTTTYLNQETNKIETIKTKLL